MDVAAVRADELVPRQGGGTEPPVTGEEAPPRRRSRRWLRALPVAVLAALVATAVLLGLSVRAHGAPDDERAAAMAAARQEAVNLTTLGYATARHDVDRILAGATGGLRAKFETERAKLGSVLAQDRSTSRGHVVSAGLVHLSGDTAQVVVAADATVTTGTGSGQRSVLKHYRMVVRLQKVSGQWLASDVAFAGMPQ